MQPYEKYVNPRIKAQEIFVQEVRRRMVEAEKALQSMETSGYRPETAMALYKFAFTLKGNGQMVGLWDIADPASDLMAALLLLGKYDVSWNPGILRFIKERLGDIQEQLLRFAPLSASDGSAGVTNGNEAVAGPASSSPSPVRETPGPVGSPPLEETKPAKTVPETAPAKAGRVHPVEAPAPMEPSPFPQAEVKTPSPEPDSPPLEIAPAPADSLPIEVLEEPATVSPEPTPVPEEPAVELPERTILLVDEDPTLDQVIQGSLQSKGFRVLSARSYREAEDKMRSDSPDLMVVDIVKKPEDGLKVSRFLRTHDTWRPIPVIFLSGQDMAQEKLAGYTTQADDFLPQPFKSGELVTRIQVILNRSDRKSELVFQDELTKLYNRRFLLKRMNEELAFAQRAEGSFSLGMFNLDTFKRVNEMYGRMAGNETLICLIERIQSGLRAADLLTRFGEDTFVVLMPNTTKYEGFCFMDRIREAVSREPFPLWQRWLNIHLTISAGISSYPIDGESVEHLLKAAESNMVQAKKDGKNRVNM